MRYSPRTEGVLTKFPEVLKITLGLNVGLALVSATLVAVNLERFEVISHQIEYAHSTLAAMVDVILIISLVRAEDGVVETKLGSRKTWVQNAGFVFAAMCVAASAIQIGLYNGLGYDEEGYPAGETPAHYVEFSFDFLSANILYWFCIDNAFRIDVEQTKVMVSQDRDMRLSVSNATIAGVGPRSHHAGSQKSEMTHPSDRSEV